MGCILRMQSWFNIWKSVNGIHHINSLRRSHDCIHWSREPSGKISWSKTFRKPGTEGNSVDLIKCTSTKNPTSNITLNRERLISPEMVNQPVQRARGGNEWDADGKGRDKRWHPRHREKPREPTTNGLVCPRKLVREFGEATGHRNDTQGQLHFTDWHSLRGRQNWT